MSLRSRVEGLRPGGSRASSGLPAGMVPAEKIAAHARRDAATAPTPAPEDRELVTRRDRLIEQFALQQAELGGVFYEMAVRDHIRLDVLTQKAAALQRVDEELAEVERALRGDDGPAVGSCPSCGSHHGADAHFCSHCGYVLQPTNGAGRRAAPGGSAA